MKFSPSMIRTWMKCGLQAKFNYIDKIPQQQNAAASLGSAVHLALENYNENGDELAAIELFKDAWDRPAEYGIEPEIWPARTSFGSYREKGIKMLEEYFENYRWSSEQTLAQELRFCVPFGKHELSGIVDQLSVDVASKTIKVIDYKSGYRPAIEGLHLDIQFTSYIHAASRKEFWTGVPGSDKYVGLPNGAELYEKYKDFDIIGIWLDLRNSKSYDVGPRGHTDIIRLYRCCDEIERAIEHEVFVPSISGDSCRVCSYKDICPAYVFPEDSGKDLKLDAN